MTVKKRKCPKCNKWIIGKDTKNLNAKYRGHMGAHGKREAKEKRELEKDLKKEPVPNKITGCVAVNPLEWSPEYDAAPNPSKWNVTYSEEMAHVSTELKKCVEDLKKKNALLKDLVMRLLMEVEV